jgi:prophage regulatory protein
LDLVPYSPQHIQRLEDAGLFPKRMKLGNGGRNAKAFWVEQEIQDWIQALMDRREEPADTP